MKYYYIKEINWLNEAINLGNLLYEFNTLDEIENLHISSEPQKYSIPMEKIDAEYSDILQYKKSCLKDVFLQFKMDREMEILTTPYEGSLSNFTILTSFSWVNNSRDVKYISDNDTLRGLLYTLYSDSENEMAEIDNAPHINEAYYGNSKWGKDEIQIEVSDIIELLQMTKYSEDIKWTVLDLITNESKRSGLIEKLNSLQNIIKKHFYLVENRFYNTIEKYENNSEFIASINNLFGGFIQSFEYMNFEFNVIAYNSAALKVIQLDNIKNTSYIGLIITELMAISGYFEMKDENVIEKCKAIGDNTRFSIINLLAEKPMYLKELADALALSSATLSHHINILLQNGFVEVRVDDRKTFYSLKKKSFEELGQYLQMKANTLSDEDGN